MTKEEAWEKMEREGSAKRFDSLDAAIAEGFYIISRDGWYLKGGAKVPREAFPELLKAINIEPPSMIHEAGSGDPVWPGPLAGDD